jgi:hypothetical protein
MIGLKWAFLRNAKVVCLFLGQFGQLYPQVVQVQCCHLFIQLQRNFSKNIAVTASDLKLQSPCGAYVYRTNYTVHDLLTVKRLVMDWLAGFR